MTLQDAAREAKRLGMSYGNFVAQGLAKSEPKPIKIPERSAIPCVHCGEMFVPRKGNVRICSDDCQIARADMFRRESDKKRWIKRRGSEA